MKLAVRIIQNEHGGFVAMCPSLPGCVTRGNTREEATARLDDAIRGYMAAIGNFIPERVEQQYVEA